MRKALLTEDIALTLQVSRWLWGWLVVFSTWVIFSLWVSVQFAWASVLVAIYVCFLHQVYRQYYGANRICSLHINRYGDCFLSTATHAMMPIQVRPGSVAHPVLIVLHYRDRPLQPIAIKTGKLNRLWQSIKGDHTLIILPDQAEPQALAALRRWLRWGQATTH